ncbi:SHOCT domain-containing protein [Streptomyces sp. BE20]|uniref:SHOCT domain-containing protein n=1 Tax=unclassified Streptomyces TaxID=2593676 RepID=UPI002E7A43DA|nr:MULTISPECIES: SHOCT domain-containing protein [unclassified Streptomyces]MED7947701.1 SHOCT domain-containing protein [Streptomyces sp. BE303]MEE1824073.1 SHOCT domain-containing protein [Streptomyces sp. BE20]
MHFAANLAADYPLLNIFWTMLWFFLWILWFMLLFRIIADLFRDDSLSGWAKAGWAVFVVLLPFLGVFVYLIARGRGMGERELSRAQQSEERFRTYVRDTAAGSDQPSTADQLAKISELRAAGHITDEEFAQAKAKILA